MTEPLRVPARFKDPLLALAALSEDEFGAISRFLSDQEELHTPRDLAKQLAAQHPNLAKETDGLLGAAVSLTTRAQHDPEAAKESAKAISLAPELEIDQGKRDQFVNRLTSILLSAPVRMAAKALDLVTDYDHVYYGARILTDIRPIFDEAETGPAPEAAVVIANLKIEHYGPSGDLTYFHVALDHWDLLELRAVVDRGLIKTESSKAFLKKSSLAYLQDTEDYGSD